MLEDVCLKISIEPHAIFSLHFRNYLTITSITTQNCLFIYNVVRILESNFYQLPKENWMVVVT